MLAQRSAVPADGKQATTAELQNDSALPLAELEYHPVIEACKQLVAGAAAACVSRTVLR